MKTPRHTTSSTMARALLLLVACLAMTIGAKAQITELTSDGTKAKVHFYLRFTEQHQIRKLSFTYSINGTSHTTSSYRDVNIGSNSYFEFVVEAPYDATNKCLQYPIEFKKRDISWHDGVISTPKYNDNTASFYGDSFLFIREIRGKIEALRVDDIMINEEMENTVMYAFDPVTKLSTRLENEADGSFVWEVNTQDFRHVKNPTYDMSKYPYFTEVVLVRKSAYKSWQYNIPGDRTYGDLQKQFGSDADLRGNDVFHACAAGGAKDDAATLFSTLCEVEEQDWPTGCSATRSCAVQSYATTQDDFGGLVGHFRLTLKPRVKKWKAESWVQLDNPNSDGWATFCTPYDVKVPSGLLVLIIDGTVLNHADRLNMVSMADHPNIPAGTGVMVKGYGTFEFHPTPVGDEKISGDRTAYSGSGNKMQYVRLADVANQSYLLPYSCSEGSHYVLTVAQTTLTKEDDEGHVISTETVEVPKFVPAIENTPKESDGWDDHATNGGHIAPFKSYLCIDTTSPARELTVALGNEVDGISTPSAVAESTAIYDLTGRRTAGSRLHHGIYIVGGRKYVFK